MKAAAAALLLVAVFFAYRYARLKRQVGAFTSRMEESFDRMLAGEPAEDRDTDTEDTLFGKLNERLGRAWQIFERRGQENLAERQKLQELISDIAHQSRIPLANQSLCLDTLREETLSQEGRQALNGLQSAGARIGFLLESMIKLSRLETGVIRIKKDKDDLMDTIRLALVPAVPLAAKKQIDLYIDGDASVKVRHDGRWTAEAVLNLLDNAVKYTDEHGRIAVSVRRREVFTEICVSDTGKGIAPERQAQVFLRFYREPEVHAQEGIGIGLYLTRKIIEMQDGYVDVVSRPGEGAAFRIYIPNGGS